MLKQGDHSMSKAYKYDGEAGETVVEKAANTRNWFAAHMMAGAVIAMLSVFAVLAWYWIR